MLRLVRVATEKKDSEGRPYIDYFLVNEKGSYFRVRHVFYADYHYFVDNSELVSNIKDYVANLKQ